MKIGLNQGTIPAPLLDGAVDIAHVSGYRGIGIWMQQVDRYFAAGGDLARIANKLSATGLDVAEINFLRDWAYAPVLEREIRAEVCRMCETAKQLNGDLITAAAFGDGALSLATKNFREVCTIAADYDCRVALEFLPWAKICDLRMALEIVNGASQENGGVLLDSFHFFMGGSRLEDLNEETLSRVFHVHLSDFDQSLKGDLLFLTRNKRVYPGGGTFPLNLLLDALEKYSFQQWCTIEVLSEELRTANPSIVAKEALQSLASLLSRENAVNKRGAL
jgi:sugar phosphate isomerase/epimerase